MRPVRPRPPVKRPGASRLLLLGLTVLPALAAASTVLAATRAALRASAAANGASEQDAVVRRVDDHYNHLQSLRCTFVQHFAGLGAERTETGVLLLKKPGKMRWTYSHPEGKVFVLDGRYAWSYTAGAPQVQRVAAKQMDDLRSPLRFLLGKTRLERELAGITVTRRPSGFQIAGVPQGLEQRVARISLDVLATGAIEAMRLEERDGSITEFHFTDIAENVALPEASFRFQVPDGVPVVDALPPI